MKLETKLKTSVHYSALHMVMNRSELLSGFSFYVEKYTLLSEIEVFAENMSALCLSLPAMCISVRSRPPTKFRVIR
ncbi:hypothetical protein FACS1894133_4400 [Clostridia bacterium]|nr:hypothetical protein FACS1894133_4400 [Clostridia bacterium]